MKFASVIKIVTICAVLFLSVNPVLAQEGAEAPEDMTAEFKKDKTGTNPINFTNDLRFYYEYQNLNLDSGTAHIGTMEYRYPINSKWQLRTRIPMKGTSFNIGNLDIDEFGLGDINARLLHVPYINMEWKLAVAVGLEAWFPTASDNFLGEGMYSLGPQAFLVKFEPFGIPNTLIAPAYQHVISAGGDDDRENIHRAQMDVFVLWQTNNKKAYVLLDPILIINYRGKGSSAMLEAEAGYVFNVFGQPVVGYARPGMGFGRYRSYEFSVETGMKFVW